MNIDCKIAEAKKAWVKQSQTEARAASAVYDRSNNKIVITLTNGDYFGVSPSSIEGLHKATPEELADVHLSGCGDSIHWESLDVDYSIPGFISGVLGTKSWMSELGRRGGQVTSLVKATTARENGKKGGRPKKN